MIGLPSLHALDGAQATRIWLAAEATDMRCGFDRLAERVKAVINQVVAELRNDHMRKQARTSKAALDGPPWCRRLLTLIGFRRTAFPSHRMTNREEQKAICIVVGNILTRKSHAFRVRVDVKELYSPSGRYYLVQSLAAR